MKGTTNQHANAPAERELDAFADITDEKVSLGEYAVDLVERAEKDGRSLAADLAEWIWDGAVGHYDVDADPHDAVTQIPCTCGSTDRILGLRKCSRCRTLNVLDTWSPTPDWPGWKRAENLQRALDEMLARRRKTDACDAVRQA